MIPRLKISYEKEIVAKLMQKLSVKNKHEVPKIDKIILRDLNIEINSLRNSLLLS